MKATEFVSDGNVKCKCEDVSCDSRSILLRNSKVNREIQENCLATSSQSCGAQSTASLIRRRKANKHNCKKEHTRVTGASSFNVQKVYI